jgi:hypothetical protein
LKIVVAGVFTLQVESENYSDAEFFSFVMNLKSIDAGFFMGFLVLLSIEEDEDVL